MRRMRSQHAGVDGLAVEPLLQIVERRHLARRASPAARRRARPSGGRPATTSGKAPEISSPVREKRRRSPPCVRRLHADAVPLPFGDDSPRARCTASSLSSIGCDSISGRKVGVLPTIGPSACACEPGEQLGVRRAQPVPDLLDVGEPARSTHSASAVLASRAETPTRSAPVRSLSSAQRPVASSRVEPVRKQARDLRRRGAAAAPRRCRQAAAPTRRPAPGQISATVSAVSPT